MKKSIIKSLILGLAIVLVIGNVSSFGTQVNKESQQNKININTAPSIELQKLPRIGEKVAQRIIDFRKKNGKFKRIEEIMKVKGIGEKTFLRFKNLITVKTSADSKSK